MKIRKRARADVMQSVRHGIRRERKAKWIAEYHANPLNSMTGRQVIKFQRIEKQMLKGKKRKLTHDELTKAVEIARPA